MLIGLVGKSCSGKNYVGTLLERMGFEVLDLDVLGHEGLCANAGAIESVFGNDVMTTEDGVLSVSRKALSRKVFDDPSLRKALEDILYPWMERRILEHEALRGGSVLVLNGALLHRAGMDGLCKAVIYVDAPYEVRLKRAFERDGISEEAFQKREAAQEDVDFRSNAYRCPVFVVENGFGAEKIELNRQIVDICDRIGITDIKGNENHEEE